MLRYVIGWMFVKERFSLQGQFAHIICEILQPVNLQLKVSSLLGIFVTHWKHIRVDLIVTGQRSEKCNEFLFQVFSIKVTWFKYLKPKEKIDKTLIQKSGFHIWLRNLSKLSSRVARDIPLKGETAEITESFIGRLENVCRLGETPKFSRPWGLQNPSMMEQIDSHIGLDTNELLLFLYWS